MSLIGSRGINLIVLVVSLPLCLGYLGAERYGMMEVVIALIALTSFSDLGLGFGLQSRISHLQNAVDPNAVKGAISSVFWLICGMTAVLLITFTLVYSAIEWHYVFNVQSETAIKEAAPTILVFFYCFVGQMPFSIARYVQIGMQEGYVSEFWVTCGSIFGLGLLILSISLNAGLPSIIASIYGSKLLASICSFAYEFYIRRPELMPDLKYFNPRLFKSIFVDGITFLGLQISNIVLTSSDRLFIAHVLGPQSVAVYGIGVRLLTVFTTPLEAFINPLLPAFNDAVARREYDWLRRTIARAFKIVVTASLTLCFIIILFGNGIIKLWLGKEFIMNDVLLATFGVYFVYLCFNSILSNIMLTAGLIRKSLPIFVSAVVLSVLIKWIFITNGGLPGLLVATMLGMSVVYLIPAYSIVRSTFFRLTPV